MRALLILGLILATVPAFGAVEYGISGHTPPGYDPVGFSGTFKLTDSALDDGEATRAELLDWELYVFSAPSVPDVLFKAANSVMGEFSWTPATDVIRLSIGNGEFGFAFETDAHDFPNGMSYGYNYPDENAVDGVGIIHGDAIFENFAHIQQIPEPGAWLVWVGLALAVVVGIWWRAPVPVP